LTSEVHLIESYGSSVKVASGSRNQIEARCLNEMAGFSYLEFVPVLPVRVTLRKELAGSRGQRTIINFVSGARGNWNKHLRCGRKI
jgi:hypothetical protein